MSYSSSLLLITHRRTLLLRTAWCIAHERYCDIAILIALLHLAGTSCVAHSAMGAMDREQAISYAHFLVWAGLRRRLQEPIVVQECVDSFPREELIELLDMYDWTFSIMSPHQHGVPIRRVRQWAVGRHKVKTLGFRTLLNIFTGIFTRAKACDWKIFFWEKLDKHLK